VVLPFRLMVLERVVYRVAERSFHGYVADGSRGRRVPGILVGHDGPGLNAHTKERAAMLAELGYVALAMDLYGAVEPAIDEAKTIVKALRADPEELRRRAAGALSTLRSQPHVDAGRIAAIGFCFGGTAALELARSGADLAAVVGFHAGLAKLAPAQPSTIRCPVLICTGSEDPIVTADQRTAFMAEMTDAGVDWQMVLYGGIGHSFTNRWVDAANIPGFAYAPAADERSWREMKNFLGETLGDPRGIADLGVTACDWK
jgi:dienelactone hydrolase